MTALPLRVLTGQHQLGRPRQQLCVVPVVYEHQREVEVNLESNQDQTISSRVICPGPDYSDKDVLPIAASLLVITPRYYPQQTILATLLLRNTVCN